MTELPPNTDKDMIAKAAQEAVELDTKKYGVRHTMEKKMTAIAMYEASDKKASYRTIAEHVGVSRQTIHNWIQKVQDDENIDEIDLSEIAGRYKSRLAQEAFLYASLYYKRSVDSDKLDKASTLQLATAGKLTAEMGRLLQGESTENISVIEGRVGEYKGKTDDLTSQEKELEAKLKNLERNTSDGTPNPLP